MDRVKCWTGGMGFVLGTALLGALTGCVGYVSEPRYAGAYGQPPPAYLEGGVMVQDDYVYYPAYQVYYGSNRRQYIYLEGRSWVARPAPPRVSVDVLFSSPSVRLDFHDSPAIHHATVVRQYPKHWAPPRERQVQPESARRTEAPRMQTHGESPGNARGLGNPARRGAEPSVREQSYPGEKGATRLLKDDRRRGGKGKSSPPENPHGP
jgi:hypothetical protein